MSLPANNPLYPRSLFPLAVDTINDVPDSVADAVCAVQATLLGASGSPPLAAMSAGTVTATSAITVGAATLRGGSGAPATGLGAIGDYYFRTDTPATANQRIYVKTGAATWTGIV